jgi:hypothetical protein
MFGSGRFWMAFWLGALAVLVVWGGLTFMLWLDSVRNLNVMTVIGLWIACGAGVQATLAMRKSDPQDPL